MKLSKVQMEILEEAKKDIDKARNSTFFDWYRNAISVWSKERSDEEIEAGLKKRDEWEWWYKTWEKRRSGVVIIHANTRSLRKLEELGFIKIIYDSTGESFGLDEVLVLNY